MRVYFISLICLFILSCWSKDNMSNSEYPNFVPIEELKGRITKDGAGVIKIGSSIKEVVKRLENFNVKKNANNRYDVFDEGDPAISFWSKNQKDTIGFIKIFSNKYETKDGLKVGIGLKEIQKLRNDFLLSFDEMDYKEYFAPSELQIYQDDKPERLCLFYFNSEEDNLIGTNYKLDETGNNLITSEFTRDGEVNHVLIYVWRES